MATLSRLAFAFGAPTIVMATAIGVVWLSTSQFDTVMGPSRPVLFTPPSQPAFGTGLVSADAPSPPPNADEPAPAWLARARNALIPYSRAPLLTAARFSAAADQEAAPQALQCLTSAVYYEATGEPDAGKRAVAQVVVNRWANRAFPKTICGVVDQGAPAPGCQFSFMCDGSLARRPSPQAWTDAETIARAALNGYVETSVGAATHYHADYVVPVWAGTMLKLVKLGRHIFYRWPGAAAYTMARSTPQPLTTATPSDSTGAALNPLTPPTAVEPPRGRTPERSPVSDEASHRGITIDAPKDAPRLQSATPVVAPVSAPKPEPKPEPPRRPIPPPSLRVGPV